VRITELLLQKPKVLDCPR